VNRIAKISEIGKKSVLNCINIGSIFSRKQNNSWKINSSFK